jgi:ATP-dependent DNA helicase RecQ
LQIHGVGSAKLAKYGQLFLDLIINFCCSNELQELENKLGSTTSSVKVKPQGDKTLGKKTLDVVQRFETGESIASLAKSMKVKANTVFSHLYKYAETGNTFERPQLLIEQADLSEAQVETGIAAFEANGTDRLKPVFEDLDEKFEYEQLHLLRVFYLDKKNGA